jgi:hypothetical protein
VPWQLAVPRASPDDNACVLLLACLRSWRVRLASRSNGSWSSNAWQKRAQRAATAAAAAAAAVWVAAVAAAAVVGPRPLKANSRKQRWLHPPQAAVRVCQVVTQGDVSYTSQSCQQLASKRRKQHCTIADLGQLPPCKGIGCESQGPCHTPTLLARPATVFLHMCLQPLTLWACSAWAAHAAAILDSTTHQQNQRCS